MGFTRKSFIDTFPYFRDVDRRLVDEIISASRFEKISGCNQLKKEGDTLTEFVFLLSGHKRIYKTNKLGREITLYEMEGGDICVLNAVCLLSNSNLPANAESLCDLTMLLMASDNFKRLISEYPDMRTFVFSRIGESLSSVMSLISEITFAKVEERLFDYLIEKSENGKIYLTHQSIANNLGTSREVVSRLLKDFERKEIVTLSRNLIELKSDFIC